MSVLIKGLEMPETGYMDVRIFRDGTATIATGTKPYYRELEAVDVPAPHGRLIYADSLMRDIEQYHLSDGKFQHWVEVQPTIDAEPVRHGKWKVTPVYIKCSECGESFMLIPQNYCPNCGCRMDGERKEE